MIEFISGSNLSIGLTCKADTVKEMEAYLKTFYPDIRIEREIQHGSYVSPTGVQCSYFLNQDGRRLKTVPHVKEKPPLFT